jgi:hypothetical protein
VRAAPHIVAPPGVALRVGTAFAATTRVVVRYEGLGDVTFVQVTSTHTLTCTCIHSTMYIAQCTQLVTHVATATTKYKHVQLCFVYSRSGIFDD